MIEMCVSRNHGHPWDGRPGFDLIEVFSNNEQDLNRFIETAKEEKFWKVWINGSPKLETGEMDENRFSAVLYKPCGIREFWEDGPDKPHPGCISDTVGHPT